MTIEERVKALEWENRLLKEKLNEVISSLKDHEHGNTVPSSCGCCPGDTEWSHSIRGVDVEELP